MSEKDQNLNPEDKLPPGPRPNPDKSHPKPGSRNAADPISADFFDTYSLKYDSTQQSQNSLKVFFSSNQKWIKIKKMIINVPEAAFLETKAATLQGRFLKAKLEW